MDSYKKGQRAYDKKDYVKAASFWKPLAERGHLQAIRSMGNMYFSGDAEPTCLPEDYDKALYYFRLGSLKSDAHCLYMLAHFYKSGFGVKRDIHRARQLYSRSSEQGNSKAMYFLALTYYYDDYNPDYKKAYYWLNRSAQLGFSSAHYYLSEMRLYGCGAKNDFTEAYKHWILFDCDTDKNIFIEELYRKVKKVVKPMHIFMAEHLAKEYIEKYNVKV